MSERVRAGVVILDGARLAVIRRQRDGRLYHVIPGGGIEAGETAEDAACREAHEELGLTVQILGSIGRVVFAPPDGSSRYEQHYFGAEIVEGDFGTGTGPEYAADRDPARGIYEPIWLDLSTAATVEVYPKPLVARLATDGLAALLAQPVDLVDRG